MASTSSSDITRSLQNSNYHWYFTKEQLEKTPSRKCGLCARSELSIRREAANFIQYMGQLLNIRKHHCVYTGIVYMHRFYVFQSFTYYPHYQVGAAAIYLAAKVDKQPKDVDFVVSTANDILCGNDENLGENAEKIRLTHEDFKSVLNVLVQTLGDDVEVEHPHSYVVKTCHLLKASKDLAMIAYFLACNSLFISTLCVQYKPTVVACLCILLARIYSGSEIRTKSNWFIQVDPTLTKEFLDKLTDEYIDIFEKCVFTFRDKLQHVNKSPENSDED